MQPSRLGELADACAALIATRFADDDHHGAAAMLLGDGTIVTGTSPEAINPSVEFCHELEPYAAAFRLDQPVLASVCLHREPGGRLLVLSPCGVCRERLATYGPDVRCAVASADDASVLEWRTLRELLPDYWMRAFPDELPAWSAPRS